jgi:hypothetical protein
LKGAAPGYPAAAARPFNSSCKIVEKLTVSRRSDGCVVTLWGTAIPDAPKRAGIVEKDLCTTGARHDAFAEFHIRGLQPLTYTPNIA